MKLLYLVSHLGDDGPVHALLTILQGNQSRWQDQLTVVSLSDPAKDVLAPDFAKLGIALVNIPLSRRAPWQCISSLRALLKRGEFAVASSTCIRADALLAIASAGLERLRTFTTVQNIPSEDLGYLFPGLRGKLFASIHYGILRRFGNNIICVSKVVHAHLKEQHGLNSSVVMNPLSPPTLAVAEPVEPTVIYAASLSERKNTAEAICFFLQSPATKSYRLDVYGQGPLGESLKQQHQNESESRLRWLGFSRNLPTALQRAAVYVSASLSEGLPLAPQIALLCGCPCILSDIPQHRELATLSPFVFLYRPADLQDFSRAMTEALRADRAQILSSATHLRELLAPEAIATKLRDLYVCRPFP